MQIRRLKNIEVDFISLVRVPANGMGLILKGSTGQIRQVRRIDFRKFDEERQVAYGIVYAPEVVDSQGDFADGHEIEKAAYGFMKNIKTGNVDMEHSFQPESGCYVAESWLVKETDPYFYDSAGAWAVGIKVEDEGLWQSLKNGDLTGLSMAGKAETELVIKDSREPGVGSRESGVRSAEFEEGVFKNAECGVRSAEFEEGVFKKLINLIGNLMPIKKEEADMELNERFEKAEAQLTEALKGIENMEGLKKAVEELTVSLEGVKKSFEERLTAIEAERRTQDRADAEMKKASVIADIL